MRYLPHTNTDTQEMLNTIHAQSIDELFNTIPEDCRFTTPPNLQKPMTEWQLTKHFAELAKDAGGDWHVFLNAGSQSHNIPALVPYLTSRSEFLTAYTPYQPEMSQGTLQAIFEFQTLIARLTGMSVANASMYDGATATAEAVLMAQRITKRQTILVSELVHPHWRKVLETYLAPTETKIVVLPVGADARTNLDAASNVEEPAVLVMQSPNFLGVMEDLKTASEMIHEKGGLLAAGFSEPFALGVMRSPGEQGADIVFGEGQSLGLSQSFGGPGLGLLATKPEYMRQIPGRLVGQTVDNRGQRGFVLTLSTREQHIRRGKAVSNICSNSGHCALTAAVFMAAIGGDGFRRTARLNRDLAEYFKTGLMEKGFQPVSDAPTFNEFAMHAPDSFAKRHWELTGHKVLAGMSVADEYPELGDVWLFGVTETKTKEDLDRLLANL